MRLLITAVFLALTAWFALGSGSGSVPDEGRVEIDPDRIDRAWARPVMGHPPRIEVAGMDMTCQDCHGIFESKPEADAQLLQHGHIELDHGLNARCYNCHSLENRDYLVLAGEVEVPYSDVERVCAGCHGTAYRDWQKGIHGKARGSWEVGSAERELLGCTECHDPHRPAFRSMAPLPPPRTLRMKATQQDLDHHGGGKRNPLRVEPHDPAPEHEAPVIEEAKGSDV